MNPFLTLCEVKTGISKGLLLPMSFLPYQSAHAHMHTQSEVLDGGCLQVARSLSDRGYMCHWPQACLFIALEGREGVGKGRRLSRPVIVDQ